MPSELGYDALLVLWRVVINIFFREIRPRGAYNIPREGPVIFVAAPHNNQFLDPLLLMSEVQREVGRRVAFLIAAKSMKRAAVGFFAGMMSSIPVARAGDDAKNGSGTITISSEDPCLIRGTNTRFTTECKPQMQIQLPKYTNSAASEIVEIISDTELRIKKEFGQKILDKLAENDEQGVKFKLLPYIDQKSMYENVYRRLQDGGCFGIFPEGGSHDRTDLLPLKAGVAIMALGAMTANPDLKVKIVPVGLSYFHPDRFRSRAVVEFGTAMDIPPELVELFKEGGPSKRIACGKLLDIIYDGLKTVTLRAPDYETLMVIQAGRRLYKTPGQHLSLGQVVELNKRFIDGYLHFKDEPRIQQLRANVLKYNRLVRDLGLRDHQVPRAQRASWKTFGLLTYRIGLLVAWSVLALPGLILNGPIFLLASIISKKKAKEALAASSVKIAGRDVLASWKVLISLGVTPFLYGFYAFLATIIAIKAGAPMKWRIWTPFLVIMALPVIGYCALKFGEAGIDVLKSLRPLIVSLFPGQQKLLEQLKEQRKSLSNEVADVINEFGPTLYEDFDEWRILVPSASAPPSSSSKPGLFRTRSATGGLDAQGNLLVHPMKWLDERLFGWSRSPRRGTSVWGGASSVNTSRHVSPEGSDDEDHGDYDNVIGYLPHEGRAGPSSLPRERSSKSLRSSYADLHNGRRPVIGVNTGEPSAVATGANVHLTPIYHQKRTVTRSPERPRDAPPSPTLRSSPRERRQSLSGSVGVERIGDVSPIETFKEATEDINREIQHDD